MELFGIRLVGFNTATGHKVLLTIGLLLVLWLIRSAVLALLGRVDASGDRASRIGFWARQGVSLAIAALAMIGFVSIWFDDPANLTTAVGLVTAGLAFALQKVVTSLAGYTTGSRSRCVSSLTIMAFAGSRTRSAGTYWRGLRRPASASPRLHSRSPDCPR
jgi:hypothetical protein